LPPSALAAAKSPDAFRTISEVAAELDVPQHVLRFWESRFAQIKPVKRAGGRRYYRPEDVDLLKGIRALLYTDGLTIRGAQKVLKERGVRHVAAIGRGQVPESPAPVVIEKVVYVEKPASDAPEKTARKIEVPARKRPHLRAVPDPVTLPLFDAPEQPSAARKPPKQKGLESEERSRLVALLAELEGLKQNLVAARRRARQD